MKVIMIYGYKNSGKSTAAKQLKKVMETRLRKVGKHHKVRIFSFATPIKQMAIKLLGMPSLVELEKVKNEHHLSVSTRGPVSMREFLQTLGQELRVRVGKRVWANMLLTEVMSCAEEYIVIDDARFVEEYEAVCDKVGKHQVITMCIERASIPKTDTDISEVSYTKVPMAIVIDNNKDIENLTKTLEGFSVGLIGESNVRSIDET
jgi:hypothetical protein